MRRGISFLAGTLFLLAGAASAWAEGRTGPYKVGDVVETSPDGGQKTFRLSITRERPSSCLRILVTVLHCGGSAGRERLAEVQGQGVQVVGSTSRKAR
jgi:hypothetical protein